MRIFVVTALLFMLIACSSRDNQVKQIQALEKSIMDSARADIADTAAIHKLLAAYEGFAKQYPKDSLAPEFLFRSADFYRAMHQPLRSIETYKKIFNEYPQFRLHSITLFLQGFVFENDVRNYEAAKMLYREFLQKFPNDRLAGDVQITLQNLGKTPEQMYEEMMARRGLDSLAASADKE